MTADPHTPYFKISTINLKCKNPLFPFLPWSLTCIYFYILYFTSRKLHYSVLRGPGLEYFLSAPCMLYKVAR